MKQTLLILISFLFIFASCDEVFLEVDGKEADLQGKWKMASADTIFFNFQNHLFQYQLRNTQNDTTLRAFGYYTLYADTAIRLELIKKHSTFHLEQLGWDMIPGENGNDTVYRQYHIDKLTSRKLILSTDEETLTLDKF